MKEGREDREKRSGNRTVMGVTGIGEDTVVLYMKCFPGLIVGLELLPSPAASGLVKAKTHGKLHMV